MIFESQKIFDASFDVFANNYDDVRPGYPQQMYKDIQEICKFSDQSEILEIGAGSGIATVELAKFGYKVTGIEPGASLAKTAKQKTIIFPNVKIIEAMFEDFKPQKKFDCLIALTSFHWINEQEKYRKVYNLLNEEGCFITVWNSFFQTDSPVTKEVNTLYQKILPDIYSVKEVDVNVAVLNKLSGREKEINNSDLFYTHFLRKYITVYNYDSKTYPMLLNTFPKIIKTDKQKREKFLTEIGVIVKKYGKISISVLTTLLITKKKDAFLSSISKA